MHLDLLYDVCRIGCYGAVQLPIILLMREMNTVRKLLKSSR